MTRTKGIAGVAAVFAVALGVSTMTARASHQWGCYKFPDAQIRWYNGGTGDYYNIYQEEAITDADSWHNSTVIDLTQVGGPGSSDQVDSYNGAYGDTGWLGVAVINVDGCTILSGRTHLNETYLESGFYTRVNKSHVACQELAHTFGLDHNRVATDTCMNDTILTAPHPNAHDREQLAAMYPAPPPTPPPPTPTPGPVCGSHNLQCYPSLRQCQAECCGVCERRINCGGATAHKCFE